jgi:predicted RNA-binding Zn-ribbon protein involved in translation (DUF1610 family)
MYFCSKCGNLYDITNTPPSASQSSEQQSISDTVQKTSNSKNKKILNENKKIFHVCNTCGNTEILKPGTLIFSKKSQDMTKEYYGNIIKPEYLINCTTLPHTRDYICPNASCPTQAQPQTRDAIMSRIGNSYKMQYVCAICKTVWK